MGSAVIEKMKGKIDRDYSAPPDITGSEISSFVETEIYFLQVGDRAKTKDGREIEHYWNMDPETGDYVDFTAKLLDPDLPDVYIVKKGSPGASRYHEEWNSKRALQLLLMKEIA